MSSVKPLTLYCHGPSPNPWKVLIILEELGVPYKLESVENTKSKEFLEINPNGRVPALEDPNTGVTTWESGSNIDYLIETYDKEHKLTYASSPEKFWERNWAHFQMSGQGPYFGQKAWFSKFHPEKVESAIDRYANEIKRVLGVIELHLTKTKNPYLVGSKVTYADLMWVPWNTMLGMLLSPEYDAEFKETYPRAYDWHQKVVERPSVKKMIELRAKTMRS